MSDNPSSFDHAFRSADNKTDDNDTIKFYKPPKQIVFFDTEVSTSYKRISDTGAVIEDGTVLHTESVGRLLEFLSHGDYICGHNIFEHDLKYLDKEVKGISAALESVAIDTLYLSPLLFPKRPYHSLLKDDKLESDELNNPVNDSIKAKELFYDELNAYNELPSLLRQIYYSLLSRVKEFRAFFSYTGDNTDFVELSSAILNEFDGRICSNAELQSFIDNSPTELAYALALINTNDRHSITPRWLLYNFPQIENIIRRLCSVPCGGDCPYCKNRLDIHKNLKKYFGFDDFRKYNGETLQQDAVQAAVDGRSLLAIFPTGGGKSITFQLPALMAGDNAHALTVVISPLQSLMKDQVDNLQRKGISDAVTINGLLDPIERANSIRLLTNGTASLLYISPELLRSKTLERILVSRNIARVVIDEAHCFSAWGQDFRVDYLYIGDFIKKLQQAKRRTDPIPVSCFTATAKQKVISDIQDYFRRKLGLNLETYTTSATRENLHYKVLYQETDEDKYNTLRGLIAEKNCPTIVYVSRTRRSVMIAEKLSNDGFPARAYNGRMSPDEKTANQEAFITNQVGIMVATSAFGMGVDKSDVKLVIHYDISDSLENYVQEAGRAGRDPSLQADCYVLFNNDDLNKHFILLNQTKLSISEINQVWRAVKKLTKERSRFCCSALEIARAAGWDDSVSDMETRVKTAVSALENAGYVKRENNVPHVYATSIMARNMTEAGQRIDGSPLFYDDRLRTNAKRIIRSLISSRSIAAAGNDDSESRVDYLADTLGIEKREVIEAINLMRQEGLLADSMDMSAYIYTSDNENRSLRLLERFAKLETFLMEHIKENGCNFDLKEINDKAIRVGITGSSIKNLRTLIYFLTIKGYVKKTVTDESVSYYISPEIEDGRVFIKQKKRMELCRYILDSLFSRARTAAGPGGERSVEFSVIELLNEYRSEITFDNDRKNTTVTEIEDALLYLSKIGALKIEGGFLVIYNGMEIKRLVVDNKRRYKAEDYRFLDDFYKHKIQQIHVVGEYANLMVRDYDAALQFVSDYFLMDFRKFISKYFKGERMIEINRNITPEKYHQLFDELSDIQRKIINDSDSKYIVAVAGPGSGKTRVLVHKLASLLWLEEVKHEQLLMLTFSRSAATEFKKRLMKLIGNAANFVEIKTFHSYCFDILGKIGSLEGVEDVVSEAARQIENGEIEQNKITKSVLVIDEAQDMDKNEFRLVQALIRQNDDMRVIAVGDDDQNIFAFRGSDPKYMRSLIEDLGAVKYEMNENFRSGPEIVAVSNAFAASIKERMKSKPIVSTAGYSSAVTVVKHKSCFMYQTVAESIIADPTDETICILTETNDQALQMQGLLIRHGIAAKLIQDTGRYRFYNLAEVRYLLKKLEEDRHSPVISDNAWEFAKRKLSEQYSRSDCLETVLNMMNEFEIVNNKKYYSDLIEFIKESSYEDFYPDGKNSVTVSTIHKSKGREFDRVYILITNGSEWSEEDKRKLYVGMTRAKKQLHIHCCSDLFLRYSELCANFFNDESLYPEPAEITLQMTHKDVFLDYSEKKRELIFRLRSGDRLTIENNYLIACINGKNQRVVKFSRDFSDRLRDHAKRGYLPCSVVVRFIVAWKNDKHEKEIPVILSDITLKKDAAPKP